MIRISQKITAIKACRGDLQALAAAMESPA
jgi:hypothetical protein